MNVLRDGLAINNLIVHLVYLLNEIGIGPMSDMDEQVHAAVVATTATYKCNGKMKKSKRRKMVQIKDVR